MSAPQPLQFIRRSRQRRDRIDQQLQARCLRLREVSALLGISFRLANQWLAEGRFPIPALPRRPRGMYRFSSVDVDAYLRHAATEDVHLRNVR